MASVLDIGLFEHFEIIFPFLFSVVLVYSLLHKTKFVSDNHSVNGIIGIIVGFMVIFSEKAVLLIKFMTPWFVLLFIFIMLMLMAFKMFGATDEDIRSTLMGGKQDDSKAIAYWIIILSIMILVIGLGSVYGPGLTSFTEEGDTESFEADAWSAFFHPKVVGLVFISLVGVFTIQLLAGEPVRIKK